MGALKLLGWLVVIALFGFTILNIAFDIVEKFLEYAETNLTTVLVICLLIFDSSVNQRLSASRPAYESLGAPIAAWRRLRAAKCPRIPWGTSLRRFDARRGRLLAPTARSRLRCWHVAVTATRTAAQWPRRASSPIIL